MSFAIAPGYSHTARSGPVWLQPAFIAVLGAMSFNFALCFVNTKIAGTGTGVVIACEAVIILAVLLYAYPVLDYQQFVVISAALLYLIAISGLRIALGSGLDVKPVRDLLIPIAFFLLGAQSRDLRVADAAVYAAVLIVIAVGLFEYFLPDVYTRFFNIAGFYIERGAMGSASGQQSSNLFTSGLRPEGFNAGRNFLPFLGSHRVSSIFLEPVSAGNFGIVVFIWALVRSLARRKVYWGLFAAALLIVVMADSRFGMYFCAASLLLAALPANLRTVAVAVLPLFALLTLLFLPDLVPPQVGGGDNFLGRLQLSAQIFGRLDALNWLGVETPDFFAADSGYSYALIGIGIGGIAMFWGILLSLRGTGPRFYLYRDLAGAYFAFLLCVSNSPFTIKTGALLWFLAGVLSRAGPLPQAFVRRPVAAAPGLA